MIVTLTLTIMIIITTDHRQAATIAAELLRGGTSPTAEALVVPQANLHLYPHHHRHFHNNDGDIEVLTVSKPNHDSHHLHNMILNASHLKICFFAEYAIFEFSSQSDFDLFAEHASVATTRARRLTKGAACLLVPGLSLAAHIWVFFGGGRITKIFCF